MGGLPAQSLPAGAASITRVSGPSVLRPQPAWLWAKGLFASLGVTTPCTECHRGFQHIAASPPAPLAGGEWLLRLTRRHHAWYIILCTYFAVFTVARFLGSIVNRCSSLWGYRLQDRSVRPPLSTWTRSSLPSTALPFCHKYMNVAARRASHNCSKLQ